MTSETHDIEIMKLKASWLNSRRYENTRETYRMAIEGFEKVVDLNSANYWDVVEYMQSLKERGLTAATVNLHLAAISSFYTFAVRKGVCEKNPADNVERLKVTPYGKAGYLEKEDCRRLLAAIDRKTYKGARDYALLFGYLMTGLRNSAWRVARWSDFATQKKQVWFTWSLKGKTDQRAFIAPPLWEALLDLCYVQGGNRKYVFTGTAAMTARDSHKDEPIDRFTTNKILKGYARQVGLNAAKVHIHMLRHSHAMLRQEAGDDLMTISRALGHSSFAVTQIYLDHLKLSEDASWQTVSEFLGVEQ